MMLITQCHRILSSIREYYIFILLIIARTLHKLDLDFFLANDRALEEAKGDPPPFSHRFPLAIPLGEDHGVPPRQLVG
jgi:hypothetical protein